jgi:hypothetical protein
VRGQEVLVGQQVVRGPVGDDPARGEQDRALAQRRRERQVVRDDQQGALELVQRLDQLAAGAGIASTVAIATRRR